MDRAAPGGKASGFPTGAWKTLRVSHTAHSPDDEHGDISIELTEGTFLKSFDTWGPNTWGPNTWGPNTLSARQILPNKA